MIVCPPEFSKKKLQVSFTLFWPLTLPVPFARRTQQRAETTITYALTDPTIKLLYLQVCENTRCCFLHYALFTLLAAKLMVIVITGWSLFARRYLGNRYCFIFLWLLRCSRSGLLLPVYRLNRVAGCGKQISLRVSVRFSVAMLWHFAYKFRKWARSVPAFGRPRQREISVVLTLSR
jgi:hypothetical protein